ncbi:MAG TPA: hydrogenase [Lachnoclostridium sp.]|nr:hydrogenase [Lachnoclostridium sp.]
MIEIIEKSMCCGCSACAEVCPKQCIAMQEDEEGFQYPFINKRLCIDCHLCEKVCPVINASAEQTKAQRGYIVQHNDDSIRIDSTSGGAFTAMAQYVLQRGGVVFGVALNEKLRAMHIFTENENDLALFRNSKYMQSDIVHAFTDVEHFLKNNRIVLFSGTGCQIEGLLRFLRKDYANLIAIDVVCRAVPSPLVFDKYIEYCNKQWDEPVVTLRFRDKYYGYKYSTLTMQTDSGKLNYHNGVESDPWLRAYFSNMIDRPSCHHCVFKKKFRQSDVTIWDCFNVGEFDENLNDDKGTTRVLVHSEKGQDLINEIKSNCRVVEINPERLTHGVKELVCNTPANDKREDFFKDVLIMDGESLFKKWFPIDTKAKMKHAIRMILYKTGLYAHVKVIVWKAIGKK